MNAAFEASKSRRARPFFSAGMAWALVATLWGCPRPHGTTAASHAQPRTVEPTLPKQTGEGDPAAPVTADDSAGHPASEEAQPPQAIRIGVIVSLSGRGREVGKNAVQGIVLASRERSPNERPQVEIVVRDDTSNPQRAHELAEELISQQGVVALIGGLQRDVAGRAARQAQHFGVPFIALTPNAEVVNEGAMVHRASFSTAGEVGALVRVARQRGAVRVALLRPANAFGQTVANALARALDATGGQLVFGDPYPPDARSFAALAKVLAASKPDAVLMADSGLKVSLLAPTLASVGLWSAGSSGSGRSARRVLFLVPSVGFDMSLVQTSGRYLQGSVFSLPFFPPTATGSGRAFADQYQAQFGAAPDSFAAFAYDATHLLIEAAVRAGGQQHKIADILTRLEPRQTASPLGGFSSARAPLYETRLLELRGNAFVPLEPARESEAPQPRNSSIQDHRQQGSDGNPDAHDQSPPRPRIAARTR
jgi:branched-chain amino acid transport system substrate-binding protein